MSNELSNNRTVLIARWSSSKTYVIPKNIDLDDDSVINYWIKHGKLHIHFRNGDKLIIPAICEDDEDYDTSDIEIEDADDHSYIDYDEAPPNEFIPAPVPAPVPAPAPVHAPTATRILIKKVTINNILYLVRNDNGNLYDFNTREEIGMNYNFQTGETTTYEV